ncbi:hypothetical protein PINS_up002870 [Pythium insidiosum]|nr:hypothetical protein PINS_up002870 [Pythium insidiosum]
MGPGRYGPVVFRESTRGTAAVGGAVEKGDDASDPKNRLQAMRWGLVPSFTKPQVKPDHFIMFNARSENLHDRPAFRRLLEGRRCVILADGYFEWQQVDKREKQPYYVYRESGAMKFAGLYDSWVNQDGETMFTYTILTTEISPEMAWMHTRTPVILTDDGAEQWLSNAKFETLRSLLVAYRGDDLKWHAVDKKVGSTKFQSEDCIKKVDVNHAGKIKSFFSAEQSSEKPKEAVKQEIKQEKPAVAPCAPFNCELHFKA